MKITPEDLLACAVCMTEAQKASFCELIDPAMAAEPEGDPVFGWSVQGGPAHRSVQDNPGPQAQALQDIQFGALNSGLLLTAAVCRVCAFDQTVNPARLLGPEATEFESVGRFTLHLEEIWAPEQVFRSFLDRYGHAAEAARNHLHLALRNQPASLEVRNCVITNSAPALLDGAVLRVSHMTIAGTRLCQAAPSPGKSRKLPGMVGWVLGRWQEDHEARTGAQSAPGPHVAGEEWASRLDKLLGKATRERICQAAPGVLGQLVPPSACDSPDAPDKLQDRWDLAQARWQRTFGEEPIPMVTLKFESSATALDTIEGMLYDKANKGREPERCACGCGFVIGCQGYQVLR